MSSPNMLTNKQSYFPCQHKIETRFRCSSVAPGMKKSDGRVCPTEFLFDVSYRPAAKPASVKFFSICNFSLILCLFHSRYLKVIFKKNTEDVGELKEFVCKCVIRRYVSLFNERKQELIYYHKITKKV